MERKYYGTKVIKGTGKGKIKILDCSCPDFEIRKIEDSDKELGRFVRALKTYCENTRKQIKFIEENIGHSEMAILNSHIKIVHDLALQSALIKKISNGMCAEQATCEVCDMYIKRFENADQNFVREIAIDVFDVKLNVLNLLLGIKNIEVEDFGEDTIVVCEELPPSVVVRLDRKHTKAIVVDVGSKESHGAKIAKAMNIPSICGIKDVENLVKDGESAVVEEDYLLIP